MAVTITGTPAAANATSIALPVHAIGDVIVIIAMIGGVNTVPGKPAAAGTVPAWVDIDAITGTNTCACHSVYFTATATNHTSGTWTTVSSLAAIVLRGANGTSPIGGHGQLTTAAQVNTVSVGAITMQDTSGNSVLLYVPFHRSVTAWGAATAGFVSQASTVSAPGGLDLLTKTTTTSDGSMSQACTAASNGTVAQTIEIVAPATVMPRRGGVLNRQAVQRSYNW